MGQCSSCLSVAVINTDQKQLGEEWKSLFYLTLAGDSSCLKEVSKKSGLESGE